MTEAEWLACDDPAALLQVVGGKAGQRKLRLYFVACCERVSHLFVDAKSRAALGCARRYADGLTNARELGQAGVDAKDAWGTAIYKAGTARHGNEFAQIVQTMSSGTGWAGEVLGSDAATNAAAAVMAVVDARLESYAKNAAEYAAIAVENTGGPEAGASERAAQAALLCDIFGNPFRPFRFSPSWRTDTAVLLAKQMYAAREFSAMPILADALQDAGGDNTDILDHCRDANATHVRGCWVVDLVLGKE